MADVATARGEEEGGDAGEEGVGGAKGLLTVSPLFCLSPSSRLLLFFPLSPSVFYIPHVHSVFFFPSCSFFVLSIYRWKMTLQLLFACNDCLCKLPLPLLQ